jgi:non-heme chloroperoxidase
MHALLAGRGAAVSRTRQDPGAYAEAMMKALVCCTLLLLVSACGGGAAPPGAEQAEPTAELRLVQVEGAALHYLERGAGEPVIFVHGGLADFREWEPVLDELGNAWRGILYSRRHNWPNDNLPLRSDHSALTEARDLAALIRELGLPPVHLVGTSYGAYTVLMLLVNNPELVRSATLAEPPLIDWLSGQPGGQAVHADFMRRLMTPSRRAFERNDREGALRIALDFFVGEGVALPAELMTGLRANLPEWEALMTSSNPFPAVSRAELRRVNTPVLMLTGENTYDIAKLIDPAVEAALPRARRVIIAEGTHDMCVEQPARCAVAIRDFLSAL